jgi:transposase-like protein
MHPSKFGNNSSDRSGQAAEIITPTACPACQSRAISTTARKPDENAYWRCGGCGEVWNVARRQSRPSGVRPWR